MNFHKHDFFCIRSCGNIFLIKRFLFEKTDNSDYIVTNHLKKSVGGLGRTYVGYPLEWLD